MQASEQACIGLLLDAPLSSSTYFVPFHAGNAWHCLLMHLHSAADSPNKLGDLDPGKACIYVFMPVVLGTCLLLMHVSCGT